MIKKLKFFYDKLYRKNKFMPSAIGIFTNPSYFIRKGLYDTILLNKKYMKGLLLDFGCGNKPYKELFEVNEYIGVDMVESGHNHKNENIDVYYDGKILPFQDNHFDSIFSSEVFEHIFNLDEILKELYRVLKTDGYILITIPFVWNEHEVPYDCSRYTSFGINHILEKSGFEIISQHKTTNFVETIFQMWNIYISESFLPSRISFKKAILILFLIAPFTILGLILSKILPKNNSFYNNIVILAKK